ncbi:SH3-like domain-containing protein [Mycobacterium parmense]|uniref:nitrile hydratase n=1 Tax=Mycobacterium parmense TaxID=185642 RepID=A0A7I7Z1E4_9MYCO|nr:SH3-like domain-containing protein [Mycobacterium parmense]MCV7352589.1 nitrile hydratase subunit beta [Mycobacterium parmense]ORW55691.1 nitrile hydratase [Mycobacterium parmense]BBZ47689.1 nitrile hydratase subunit beta [Mycobacterium parmense]
MSTAAERARQLALVSRLKTTFPEVPEWPAPDEVTHDQFVAYMKTPHDVGGELNVPQEYWNKEEEQWELMTYVLCEVLGWRGIWVSEERRRLGNVDVGRSIYLGLPYYTRWLWSVGRLLIEKKHITWGELTDRLMEVQARYAGGLDGRKPEAEPKSKGEGSAVNRNRRHLEAVGIGDPQCYAGQAGTAKFQVGDRVRVRELPAMFYTRTPEYCRGAEGVIAEVSYESPAAEDETWDREDAKPEWFYIVRFNQSQLWDNYTGPKNDTLQTEIPERWLESVG